MQQIMHGRNDDGSRRAAMTLFNAAASVKIVKGDNQLSQQIEKVL
jgi:hypothetical protein